jgi:hypothetical protein
MGQRTQIDVAEYERIMKLPPEEPLAERPKPGAFRFNGFVDDRRTYVAG